MLSRSKVRWMTLRENGCSCTGTNYYVSGMWYVHSSRTWFYKGETKGSLGLTLFITQGKDFRFYWPLETTYFKSKTNDYKECRSPVFFFFYFFILKNFSLKQSYQIKVLSLDLQLRSYIFFFYYIILYTIGNVICDLS